MRSFVLVFQLWVSYEDKYREISWVSSKQLLDCLHDGCRGLSLDLVLFVKQVTYFKTKKFIGMC